MPNEELVDLKGSHREPVKGAERVRDVDPGEEITVTVYVRRDPAAHPVTDPAVEALKRPQDRHYLSPSEVEASFGAAPADLKAVADYAVILGQSAGGAAKNAAQNALRNAGSAAGEGVNKLKQGLNGLLGR